MEHRLRLRRRFRLSAPLPCMLTALAVLVSLPLAANAQASASSSAALADREGMTADGSDVGTGAAEAGKAAVPARGRQAGVTFNAPYERSERDIAVGIFGQLTPTRTTSQYSVQNLQGATPTVGVLGSFHQQFRPFLGYDANFGYTRFTENYEQRGGFPAANGVVSGSYTRGSISSNVLELSGAFVARGRGPSRQIHSFAQLGGGVLMFLPTTPADYQGYNSYRAAALFGAGVDYKVSERLGLRVEYRGLLYKNPDFAAHGTAIPVSKVFTVTSEPTVSLTYRFGARRAMQ